MKTAISLPDDIFRSAEKLARRTKRSRSRLFTDAMREYLARHSQDEITEQLNKTCSDVGESDAEFANAMSRRTLERTEW